MANYILNHTGAQIDEGIDAAFNIENTIAARIGTSGPAAGRNLVDNADFQIWTRGESVTVADNAGQCCADRHYLGNVNGTGATATMSKSTMLVDGVTRSCGMVTLSAAVGSFTSGKHIAPFVHTFEGRSVYRYLSPGKSFTVGVDVEASVAGKYAVAVRNADSTYTYVHTVTLAANTPTAVAFTVPIPSTAGIWSCPNTEAAGLNLVIGGVGHSQLAVATTDAWVSGDGFYTSDCVNWAAMAGATIKVTRVRLEEGSTLGSYQAKNYEEDEARCRYFLPLYEGVSLGNTSSNSPSNAFVVIQHTPPARVAPSGIILPSTNQPLHLSPEGGQVASLSIHTASKASSLMNVTPTSSITPGHSLLAYFNNNTPGKIIFTGAEL